MTNPSSRPFAGPVRRRTRALRSAAVSLLALAAHPALAEDVALVLGNTGYDNLDRFQNGTEVVDASDALADAGFTVISLANGDDADLQEAAAAFLARVPGAERLVIVLSGRFATDGTRSWYLPSDTGPLSILTADDTGLSLETLLTLLAEAPGRAILVMATDEAQGDFDPWISLGVAPFDVPQGVTVLTGSARRVATFVEEGLAVPGGDLIEALDGSRLTASGYVPDTFAFLPPAATPEPVAEPQGPIIDRAAEQALWEGAVALDTEAAYANYLARYPGGIYAEEAVRRRTEIASEPNRAERLAEEALQLSRDDRRDVQRALTLLQFNTRGIDGIFGPGTRGAITNWQQQNGFAQTGYLTSEQVARIEAQAARRSAEIEAEAERQRQEQIRQDQAYWEETGAAGDAPGLRTYLERYPDGIFADAAEARLAAIEEQQRRTAAAEDTAAWTRADQAGTLAAYQDYVSAFPQGRFVENARARITQLSQEQDDAPRQEAARQAEAALGLNQLTMQLVEQRLDALGLEPGTVDGQFDRETRRAIRRFQRDREIEPTGFMDEQTVVTILADALQ